MIQNDYVIRAIGSNIDLNRFYENVAPSKVIDELISLSKPNLESKTLFIWPEGIIPNISQEELTQFSSLFDKRFNQSRIL